MLTCAMAHSDQAWLVHSRWWIGTLPHCPRASEQAKNDHHHGPSDWVSHHASQVPAVKRFARPGSKLVPICPPPALTRQSEIQVHSGICAALSAHA